MAQIKKHANDEEIIHSVLAWTKNHFSTELELDLHNDAHTGGEVLALQLRGITAIISLGGSANALIAYSFDPSLANYILEKELQSFGGRVEADEKHQMMLDTLAETINVILGNCTIDLAKQDNPVVMSTPLVIEEGGRACRPKGSFFSRISFTTAQGLLDVVFITPTQVPSAAVSPG